MPDIATVNSSDRYALIAVQGPKAQEILQTLTAIDLPAIKYYWFAHGEIAGVRGTVSRTGYTGEDGFEVMVPPAMAARVWDALRRRSPARLIPAGPRRRDTLRLEAAMRLYGNDPRLHHHGDGTTSDGSSAGQAGFLARRAAHAKASAVEGIRPRDVVARSHARASGPHRERGVVTSARKRRFSRSLSRCLCAAFVAGARTDRGLTSGAKGKAVVVPPLFTTSEK